MCSVAREVAAVQSPAKTSATRRCRWQPKESGPHVCPLPASWRLVQHHRHKSFSFSTLKVETGPPEGVAPLGQVSGSAVGHQRPGCFGVPVPPTRRFGVCIIHWSACVGMGLGRNRQRQIRDESTADALETPRCCFFVAKLKRFVLVPSQLNPIQLTCFVTGGGALLHAGRLSLHQSLHQFAGCGSLVQGV